MLACRRPRLALLVAEVAPRTRRRPRRIPVASAVVLALAVPGGTPLPQQSGVLVASRRTAARQGDHAVDPQMGARGNAELVRLSFGRFGDAIAARHRRRRRC